MLDAVFPRPQVRSRLRANRLGGFIDEFVAYLQTRGHARSTIRACLWAVEHFGSWLPAKGPIVQAVNRESVRSFLRDHLPECRCPSPAPTCLARASPGLSHLLRFLRDRSPAGVLASTTPQPFDAVVQPFLLYLRDTCGLAESTCLRRSRFAREFLQGKFARGPIRWEALQPSDVLSFVVEYAKRCQPSAQVAASSLRSFLRYLQFQGWCQPALVAAVPRIAQWRRASLPRTMTDEQLQTFLAVFDLATPTGRRDYAMALCQVDLGLRVSEVAGLGLEDIDWRAATLRLLPGKIGRARELPLPQRVGQAIADYLRGGRLAPSCRNVFVRHRVPQGAPVTKALIRGVMRLAYAKVPGCEHWAGTHVLRHTAATRLHRHGATLKEVADILGHRSLGTTTIYTKVDLPGLTAVALPWPEARP
jgi:integrase/recombinase XerD